jgi:hypothetical protein
MTAPQGLRLTLWQLSTLQGGGLSEGAARCIFQQLVSAVEWVHTCGESVLCLHLTASFQPCHR